MAAEAIRVLCVDDHPMILEGIASMISRQPDMELVGTAYSGESAVQLFERHVPDVTLMDLQLPGMSGLEAIRQIRLLRANARIIVLTMFQGDEDIFRALNAGAVTYLLKDVRMDELLRVVREVHLGGRPMPANVASLLAARNEHGVLTAREADVMKLLATGLRNKEIADKLDLSEATVKVHIRNIFSKLHVNDRSAAITIAIQRGIIHLG
jgi:two-component system NarL family response regulator